MRFIEGSPQKAEEKPRQTLEEIEPSGKLSFLLQAIQAQFPYRSNAIDHLDSLLISNPNLTLEYKLLPTVGDFLKYARTKRSLLSAGGNFTFSPENLPPFLQSYLKSINSTILMPHDIKAKVDQAFFILIHPTKRGKRWVSLAHHNFTEYRGDMYGPGWAEPVYGLFGGNKPKGFEISFMVATGYDDPNITPSCGSRSSKFVMTFGDENITSFSIGKQADKLSKACIPVKVSQWGIYDIEDGQWKKGWQVFGVSSGVQLLEIGSSN